MTGRRPNSRIRQATTVRLGAEGVAKVLGDLEAMVLELLWQLARPTTARAAHEEVITRHDVALLTVVTVLNNLVGKGLLRRRKVSGVFHYAATISREDFLERTSEQMVNGILAFEPEAVAASFINVLAEQDPERLAELSRLVRRKLREQRER